MKGSRWFIIFIVAFVLIVVAIQYRMPRKFIWTPSFSHVDEQPFGCALFDSLLSLSLPQGYAVTNNTLYQMEQEDSVNRKGVLILDENIKLGDLDLKLLLKMAERGDKIMLVSASIPKELEDTLDVSSSSYYFNYASLRKLAISYTKKDTIYWKNESEGYPHRVYTCYSPFIYSYIANYDENKFKVLALKNQYYQYQYNNDNSEEVDSLSGNTKFQNAVALTRSWGKGEIILVSTPFLFTNYGVVDGDNATYILRVLSQMSDLPVYRTQAYLPASALEQEREMSPLRFIFSQPPLHWAFNLTLIAIILFMIFTAKRRQRAIPVVKEPENKSLEFIELIGTLYYQKKDHANLVIKKYTYFSELLRREIQVDLEDMKDDEHSFLRMAQKTGMSEEEVSKFVYGIRPVLNGEQISSVEMERLIDQMNHIMNKIN